MLLTLATAIICGSAPVAATEKAAMKEVYKQAAIMTDLKEEYSITKEKGAWKTAKRQNNPEALKNVAGYEAHMKLKQARRDFKAAVVKAGGAIPQDRAVKKELYKKAAKMAALKEIFSMQKETGAWKANKNVSVDNVPGHKTKLELKKARREFKNAICLNS